MTKNDKSSSIDKLIASGEGPTVDFKKVEILSNPIKLAKLMVAFANSSGGRILIGVCDDKSIEGMREKKEHEAHIMNIARDKCVPPLIPKFSVVKKPEGDIYVVKVLRYRKLPHRVITKEGKVFFIRVGSTVREAESSELALLFEATREETILKKPELELFLVDEEENATQTIHANPTIIKKKHIKRKSSVGWYSAGMAELLKQVQALPNFYGTRQPLENLVPIGVEIANVGEVPAQGIKVFLKFPEDCKLIPKSDAIGGLAQSVQNHSGGLFVDDEDKTVARAWIEILGNDLVMRKFSKIYVRFPEKEQEYKIEARITQHDFPPKNFEFSISVKPKVIEKIEYINDEEVQ